MAQGQRAYSIDMAGYEAWSWKGKEVKRRVGYDRSWCLSYLRRIILIRCGIETFESGILPRSIGMAVCGLRVLLYASRHKRGQGGVGGQVHAQFAAPC